MLGRCAECRQGDPELVPCLARSKKKARAGSTANLHKHQRSANAPVGLAKIFDSVNLNCWARFFVGEVLRRRMLPITSIVATELFFLCNALGSIRAHCRDAIFQFGRIELVVVTGVSISAARAVVLRTIMRFGRAALQH